MGTSRNQLYYNNFEIQEVIESNQGMISFRVIDKTHKKPYCLKVYTGASMECAHNNDRVLNNKFDGKHPPRFPKLYRSCNMENRRESVEQLLGPSLEKLFMRAKPTTLDKVFICKTVTSMIDRLDCLHRSGYLHGNVSLKSFYCGLEDPYILFLADFYHSKKISYKVASIYLGQPQITSFKVKLRHGAH